MNWTYNTILLARTRIQSNYKYKLALRLIVDRLFSNAITIQYSSLFVAYDSVMIVDIAISYSIIDIACMYSYSYL